MTVPDFIREAVAAQGRVDPDEIAVDETAIPSDAEEAARQQAGWRRMVANEDVTPEPEQTTIDDLESAPC